MISRKKRINKLIPCACGKCGLFRWIYDKWGHKGEYIRGHNLKVNPFSKEDRRKGAIAITGRKLSEEHKKKLSELWTGSNNPMYGKHHTIETKNKIGKANTKEKVGYSRLHVRIRNRLPKPIDGLCEMCNIKPIYDVACKTHSYEEDLKIWSWFCRSCHKKHDYKLRKKKNKLV